MKKFIKPDNSDSHAKKYQIARMFDSIAPWYDFLNHLLSLGIDVFWRKQTIKCLNGQQAKRILDLATGTGDLAIEACFQLKPEKVIGMDISNNMLELAQQKVLRQGLSDKIQFIHGDCENIPFENNTFDIITVAFGVRNFEDLEQGISEIYRVMKPKSKVVILEFSKPALFPFKQIFNLYFKYILPVIGRLTSKDKNAYNYLYRSVQAFPDRQEFADVLLNFGFRNISYKPLTLGICMIYLAEK